MKQHFFIIDLFGRFLASHEFLYFACFLISTGWAISVQAKEFYISPSISIRTEYDDNKRLRSGDLGGIDKSAFGVITRAKAKLGVRSNRYDLMLKNEIVINRYDSEFDLDSEDFKVNFKSNYTVTERNIFGLSGNYAQNTTLTSEFDDNGTGVLIQENITREQWSVSPEWTYSFSNTQFLQANYSHSEVIYEESDTQAFFDYSIDNVTVTYSQQWTELFSSFVSTSVMFFEVPEIDRDTTEYTVNIGVEYQFLPTWSTSLSVGRRFTNTKFLRQRLNPTTFAIENVEISDDVEGMIYTFNIDKKFESGRAGIKYNRSTSAQGDGRLREQDRIQAYYRYKVSQNLLFSLDGGVIVDTNSGGQNNSNDRTYYNIRPTIRWAFGSNASITAGYQYRAQEFESNSDKAESNSIFLNFNYQWDKLSTQEY